MAERRGGYRKPKKGAQVSPPGALSQRKERENVKNSRQGIMGSGQYGSTKEARELASAAPFAGKTPTPKVSAPTGGMPGMEGMVPLTAPTERPFESPEVGMPFGTGPGPMEIGLMPGAGMQESVMKQDLRKLATYLPTIEMAANAEGAPQTLRTFVKYLRSL